MARCCSGRMWYIWGEASSALETRYGGKAVASKAVRR
jgi:hypothetical protein